MFQYDNNFVVDIEDLIYDLLNYRRNKIRNRERKEIRMRDRFPFQSLIEDVDFESPTQKILPSKTTQQIKIDSYEDLVGCRQNELSEQLEIIIDEILNEYEYDGSPIFNETIDRETLYQIIQKVIALAIERIDELKNTVKPVETKNFIGNDYNLLKALVESLIINNIFLKRKPLRHDFEKFLPY